MSAKIVKPVMVVLQASIVLIVVGWILNIPGQLQISLFTEQMLAAVLGLSLALTFLTFPLSMKARGEEAIALKALTGEQDVAGPVDLVLAALSLICCFYVAIRYPELIRELVARPWSGVTIATIIVLLVFEASRRVTGLALVLIVLVLCAHALLGWMLPEMFASRYVSLSRLMVYLGVDTNALLGNTLQIAVIVVVPFIIMGQVLTRCGGSEFFSDLAASLMGQFRGGSAKIAVVGSAFFGMVSGSAVANVASVGTITIPLMKRNGFPGHTAGAIEAVGSTGGQIAPPVMGAAAFLMAEYLQVPYAEVMIAAIIPALLWYATLFMQVDLESAKLGISGAPRSQLPSIGKVMREGGHFLLPFVVLVSGLLWFNWEPEYAALMGTGALILMVLIVPHKGKRMTIRDVLTALVASGGAVVDIIAVTAIAGILIGAMNLTGVAFSLTQQLIGISGGNLPLLLLITGLAAFVLGLPLPTVGVYVILATLAAPALVQAGISPIQAHMFVLFNGLLGMVTPPVALAAFAAATIAKADQWKTGWIATRMSWCCYLIPFLFAYTPALVMRGDPFSIVLSLSLALLGILIGTMAVVGFFTATIPPSYRIPYGLIALMLLAQPAMFDGAVWLNVAGVAAAAAAIAREILRGRSQPKVTPGPQSARNPATP
ncbi:MAG: TRAP transporter fused permease subunit [Rhizobiales bacterium]|nr:TRAP transporter fused permease subunit [Hyphomicrobiales bacterium]MPZ59618.1 TRAP transporter fused permease subunit [Hyphomicrobiales bacterium]